MTVRQVRIGAVPDAVQYDDVDFPGSAIETDQPIKAGVPVDPNDVVRLDDLDAYVFGPAIAVDSNLAEFDGITGKKIKDGGLSHANVAEAIAKKHTQGTDVALGALGTKNPPIDADKFLYRDSANSDALVTSTGAQIKAFLHLDATLPAFLVMPSVAQLNIAINVSVTVVWGTEIFDQGNNFSANIFTAPVTGKYHFDVSLYLENIDTAATYYACILVTSNREYQFVINPLFTGDLAYFTFTLSCLADMDASDTAYVKIYQSGGTQQTDIIVQAFFSGHLVC